MGRITFQTLQQTTTEMACFYRHRCRRNDYRPQSAIFKLEWISDKSRARVLDDQTDIRLTRFRRGPQIIHLLKRCSGRPAEAAEHVPVAIIDWPTDTDIQTLLYIVCVSLQGVRWDPNSPRLETTIESLRTFFVYKFFKTDTLRLVRFHQFTCSRLAKQCLSDPISEFEAKLLQADDL